MLLRIVPQFAHPNTEDGSGLYARVTSWIIKILYILFSLIGGVALLCLPWFRFWDDNNLLYVFPQIRPLVANSYFKGAVLGLGVVNILIGIGEIVHITESSKRDSQ
jgi:hypothetical protein